MKVSAPHRGWTSGRATPSLRPTPMRQRQQTRQDATYRSRKSVQTTGASSLIPRALGNHQRVGGFGERRVTTDNLFPIGVGSRGQIMFAPGVDQNAIDPP